jgi:hypothetical protein
LISEINNKLEELMDNNKKENIYKLFENIYSVYKNIKI